MGGRKRSEIGRADEERSICFPPRPENKGPAPRRKRKGPATFRFPTKGHENVPDTYPAQPQKTIRPRGNRRCGRLDGPV